MINADTEHSSDPSQKLCRKKAEKSGKNQTSGDELLGCQLSTPVKSVSGIFTLPLGFLFVYYCGEWSRSETPRLTAGPETLAGKFWLLEPAGH